MHRAVALWLVVAGCHVTTVDEISRPGAARRHLHHERAVAAPPQLVLDGQARFRLIEPLVCPSDELVIQERATERTTRPNLATFVVGVLASTVGGVLLVRGATDREPASSPVLYAGIASVAIGVPLVIGPWLGNRTELRPQRSAELRRATTSEPCGVRPLAGHIATLRTRGLELHATSDRDGVLAVSPFDVIDAYAPIAAALDVTATVAAPGGAPSRTIGTTFDGASLARAAQAFLARGEIDSSVEPMRVVPGLVAGPLRASLVRAGDGTAVRVVVPLRNAGPGPAWQVRGRVVAPARPELDGRMVYVGHVPRGGSVERELRIAIAPSAAAALRGTTAAHPIELTIELRDAHGTAPTTPIRFRGPLLDVP